MHVLVIYRVTQRLNYIYFRPLSKPRGAFEALIGSSLGHINNKVITACAVLVRTGINVNLL